MSGQYGIVYSVLAISRCTGSVRAFRKRPSSRSFSLSNDFKISLRLRTSSLVPEYLKASHAAETGSSILSSTSGDFGCIDIIVLRGPPFCMCKASPAYTGPPAAYSFWSAKSASVPAAAKPTPAPATAPTSSRGHLPFIKPDKAFLSLIPRTLAVTLILSWKIRRADLLY